MSYSGRMASVLSGLSRGQLSRLRSKGIVIPEVQPKRPPIYSFRDIVALRMVSFLRDQTSLQKVAKAFAKLDVFDLTDHPSHYQFGTDGTTVYVKTTGGEAMDLVRVPGDVTLFPFGEVIGSFRGYQGDVADLHHPHRNVEIQPRRMRGQPTIEGTRVQSELIANLVDFENVFPDDIPDHYPDITEQAVKDAIDFHERVKEVA